MDTERPRAPHRDRRRRRTREKRRHRRRDASPPQARRLPASHDRDDRDDRCDDYAPRQRRGRSRSRSRSRLRSRSRSRSRSRERRRRPHDRDRSEARESRDMAAPHRRDDAHAPQDAHDHAPAGAIIDAHVHGDAPPAPSQQQPRGRDRDRDRGGRGGRRGGGGGGHGAPRRGKLSVPDNWDDVPKIGALVASSRFVAMRVPLDDKFTRMIRSPQELWTPEIFLQTQASEGRDVRLLIDLTNTTKYYDGDAEFRDSGVKYVKLCIEGFKAPPRESEVEAFVRIVDDFVAAEPRGSIAVHCTHGLNRTGYLVVSYLVRRGGMSVQDALRAFSDARPPGLIKHMYIEDLFRRFAPDASVELPELPDWASAKYAARRR